MGDDEIESEALDVAMAKLAKQYIVNEVFYSLQGEGLRAGQASVFVRFSHCNLACNEAEHGFDCDTEFASGRRMARAELHERITDELSHYGVENSVIRPWLLFTGGEPSLQLDQDLVDHFKDAGYLMAIETNGTREIPDGLDWVCVSPKTAEHTMRVSRHIDELKYVRNVGQGLPSPSLKADNLLLSPAYNPTGNVNHAAMLHCINLCKRFPPWRLSVQQHKHWGIR